jgi:hypothetical protein
MLPDPPGQFEGTGQMWLHIDQSGAQPSGGWQMHWPLMHSSWPVQEPHDMPQMGSVPHSRPLQSQQLAVPFGSQRGVSCGAQSEQISPQMMSVGWLQHSGCPVTEH